MHRREPLKDDIKVKVPATYGEISTKVGDLAEVLQNSSEVGHILLDRLNENSRIVGIKRSPDGRSATPGPVEQPMPSCQVDNLINGNDEQ